MTKAYLNYPNPHITLHRNPLCGAVQQMGKSGQRYVRIDTLTISGELQRFQSKHYSFAAHAGANDMWIEVDFADADFERALIDYIRRLLGRHYSPFGGAPVSTHC